MLIHQNKGDGLKKSLTMYEVLDILQDDHRSFEKRIADLDWEKNKTTSPRFADSDLSPDDSSGE